jgi:hypothetical protein
MSRLLSLASLLLATSLTAQTAKLIGTTSGSTAGGDLITIETSGIQYGCTIPHCPHLGVFIDTLRIDVPDTSGNPTVHIISPPHDAGPVTITVAGPLQPPVVAGTFTYVAPKQSPLTNYERVLIPVTIDPRIPVNGAAGSRWTTELVARNVAPYYGNALFGNPDCKLLAPAAEACLLDIGLQSKTAVNLSDPVHSQFPFGLILWLQKGITDTTTFSLRLRDISRAAVDAGTDIHVVRESDLVSVAQLLNVPIDHTSRAALRVYDLGGPPFPASIGIYVYRPNESVPIASRGVNFAYPSGGSAPAYSGFFTIDDLAREFPQLAERTYVIEVETSRAPEKTMWAMVSITNNETQHVTMITPR